MFLIRCSHCYSHNEFRNISSTGIKPLYADGGIANVTPDTTIYNLPVFVSGPIDVGTQSDSFSPLGLRWKRVKKFQASEKNYFNVFLAESSIDTVLLCSRCSNESSTCLNGGTCRENNNTCACLTRDDYPEDAFPDLESELIYSGPLCELDCTEGENEIRDECNPNYNFWADDDTYDDDNDDADDDDADDDGTGDDDTNADGSNSDPPNGVDENPDDSPNLDGDDDDGDDGTDGVATASNIFTQLMTFRDGFP